MLHTTPYRLSCKLQHGDAMKVLEWKFKWKTPRKFMLAEFHEILHHYCQARVWPALEFSCPNLAYK